MSGALFRPVSAVPLVLVVALLGFAPQTAHSQEAQRHEPPQQDTQHQDTQQRESPQQDAAPSGEVATLGGVEQHESDPADQGEAPEAPEALEQVVVSGEQPGPGLWKVTNGSRTLWIVSTLSPTPKELKWRSRQVESIVASAGLVFADFEVKPNIGIFRGLRYLPAILRARFNPDKATLKDLITPEQYARWLPLRKQYFKDDDDIEKVRPMLIAFALYGKAMDKAGLRDSSPVGKIMSATAKKNRVKWKTTEIAIDIRKPKELIKAFVETTPRENDVGCFLEALDNLEAEIETMKQRSAAWAVGDIEAFRALPRPAVQRMCMKAVTSAPAVDELLGSVIDRFNAAWRAEADVALATYETSIAVIDLDSLVREDGVIAHLRARGYEVEEPQ
jgi:uncharacterized protein YbaP (TraB family)